MATAHQFTTASLPALNRDPAEAKTFGLDDFRRAQLIRQDDHNLRACAAWGGVNAHWSDETIFAANVLANRAVSS